MHLDSKAEGEDKLRRNRTLTMRFLLDEAEPHVENVAERQRRLIEDASGGALAADGLEEAEIANKLSTWGVAST